MNTLIEFNNVTFAYPSGEPVLRSIDFKLCAGERISLLGANGVGKTTLLHLIVGLLRPQSGGIIAFGKARKEESDFHEVRARVGLLFQDPEDQLFCPTVGEDVAFGPLNLGKSRAEVERIVSSTLRLLGLSGYEHRITYQLSGGEKRLVSLASVLAMQPDILLLDEPTGGLDDKTTQRLIEILSGLPLTMIAISHDKDFLKAVTDKAMHLKDEGRFN